MNTVESLRKSGTKVRVIHRRWLNDGNTYHMLSRREAEQYGFNWNPDSKGGQTVVEVTSNDGTTLQGVADCSIKDSFNRKLGLKIALGRALLSSN